MTDMELNNIVQKIDICQNNREQMLRQVVDVYCSTFNASMAFPRWKGPGRESVTVPLLKV